MSDDAFAHNCDINPHWTPKVARRIYACKTCGAEQETTTNHTGTVWALRCDGTCRQILNPHTELERVLKASTPHRYIRDA